MSTMIWIILGILVVAVALFWFITNLAQKRRALSQGDRSKAQSKWQDIESLIQDDRYKEAVMEADKLLDFAMKKMNLPGETFADRLKAARDIFPNYQAIWEAHKLRNQLVHEVDAEADTGRATRAVATFKQALSHIKVL